MKVLQTHMVRVTLGGQNVLVNAKVWQLFEQRAGDKKLSLLTLAGELVKEGKMAERALADALQTFRLI